jgi:phospholipid N-methyltransferase
MTMKMRWIVVALGAVALLATQPMTHGLAQTATATQKPFEPQVGQPGKDVVWVPTSQALVDKMLDMAKVTPQDYVIDLGSGDGRTVITAAKRGAIAHGIEYNPDMVALAQKNATDAGVNGKATFVKADIFESDFSRATVITMFLLPSLNMRLRPTLLNLRPGTRIASNTFTMEDWEPDQTETLTEGCTNSWCTALLWIVPAKVAGTWTTPEGDLVITQKFQNITGTLGAATIQGKLRGADIAFNTSNGSYTGRVDGSSMKCTKAGGGGWTATRR